MRKTWIYDLETLDIFTATFVDKDSDETKAFIIADSKDERLELFQFLDTEVQALIGYNCLTFDAQVLEYLWCRNPTASASDIRRYATLITSSGNRRPDVYESNLKIPHLDLFRALSLNVKSKRTSLKWCEYMLDMDNIEDMPSQGEGDDWISKVLSYNYNDVISTKILYQKYYHEIDLRKSFGKKERLHLLNSSEPDIARKLFSKYLSSAMRIRENDLQVMRTERPVVYIKDILFPYINFKTEEFNKIFYSFRDLISYPSTSAEFSINKGYIVLDYGLGGLHGSVSNKIISSDSSHIIKSCDVRSMYPNIAIRNRLHPAHLPENTFCDLYEKLYEERISLPKSNPRNYILKIVLNALYGLTNDEFSFLKDRQMTLSICINGQLSLSMLIEEILLSIPDSQLIMANTDGFEVLIPRKYEELYYDLCKKWEITTKLELEYIDYQKMIISDVNNYIAVYADNKGVKCKGKYEFKDIPLHKNKSFNIIPIAIVKYFTEGIDIRETILNHTNIFDFCAGIRAKRTENSVRGDSHYELYTVEKGVAKSTKLSRTVRYYISNKGVTIRKKYQDGTTEEIEAPIKYKTWAVTYFNKAFYPEEFKDYDIDYSYYIIKAREWINDIQDNQLKLTLWT